jgi:tRNA (guanine-N7-)-methyltransferase
MKPSPSALRDYLLQPQESVLPLLAEQVFGRRAPLAVEVGFGGGEYLDWWAGQNPDWDFIGIELPPDCILRAARRLEQAGRKNVRLVNGDARYLLRELFGAGSLQHVLMQFPMPWPKGKHAKHRVSSPIFAATLADVLKPGCCFELVTDQDWYAQEAETLLSANPALQVLSLKENPKRPFRTRYESKWLQEGRQIYRLLVTVKTSIPAPRTLGIQAMETLHLKLTPTPAAIEALRGQRFQQGNCVAEVKEVLRAQDGWLVRLLAADDTFSQLFHARIVLKRDERCLLRVDEVPRPYYTAAVRFALASLGAVLQESI